MLDIQDDWNINNVKKFNDYDISVMRAESRNKENIESYNKSFRGKIRAIFYGKKKIDPVYAIYFKYKLELEEKAKHVQ